MYDGQNEKRKGNVLFDFFVQSRDLSLNLLQDIQIMNILFVLIYHMYIILYAYPEYLLPIITLTKS